MFCHLETLQNSRLSERVHRRRRRRSCCRPRGRSVAPPLGSAAASSSDPSETAAGHPLIGCGHQWQRTCGGGGDGGDRLSS